MRLAGPGVAAGCRTRRSKTRIQSSTKRRLTATDSVPNCLLHRLKQEFVVLPTDGAVSRWRRGNGLPEAEFGRHTRVVHSASLMADAPEHLALDDDEQALLTGLRAGDADAYETLVRTTSARLLAVARRIVGSEEDARDVLQEAYTSAFRALGRFEGQAKLSTWLHRIVVNTALMRLRSRKRKPEESIDALLPVFKDDGHQMQAGAEWADGADVALERAETRTFVRAQIDKLPDTYRTVLLLRDIEELSTSDVASMLSTSENAVKIRLHRARQALRALLDERFGRAAHDSQGVAG